MILTCPRCATRYLTDPLLVWTTGRTVQCEACGQRWRAVGEAVPPDPVAEPPPPAEPAPHAEAVPLADEPAPRAGPVDEAPAPETAAPVEAGPFTPAVRRVAASDWHATLPGTPAAPDESLQVDLSRPPPRLTTSFGSRPSGAGPWVVIAVLFLVALAALVMFRDLVVEILPGLAPLYAALGLLVHPAVPHG
jgi:predicted Zn finger-like uncharacterized protein